MSKVYNYEDSLALLNEVAKGKENFVYQKNDNGRCSNWVEKAGKRVGDCIVGQVIEKIGHIDDVESWGAAGMSFFHLENVGVEFTKRAQRLLAETQIQQDRGTPWGRAIAAGVAESAVVEDVVYG